MAKNTLRIRKYNKEQTMKTFPNVKYFTKDGHPDWKKHEMKEENELDESSEPKKEINASYARQGGNEAHKPWEVHLHNGKKKKIWADSKKNAKGSLSSDELIIGVRKIVPHPNHMKEEYDKSKVLANKVKIKNLQTDIRELEKKISEYKNMIRELAKENALMHIMKRKDVSEETIQEISTEKLAQYKKKAGEDASASDKKGDFNRGHKRFKGINRATRLQFRNETKKD